MAQFVSCTGALKQNQGQRLLGIHLAAADHDRMAASRREQFDARPSTAFNQPSDACCNVVKEAG